MNNLTRYLLLSVLGLASIAAAAAAAEAPRYRAARSVHLGYPAPEGTYFYTEMVVEESVDGSYFMACGWNTGYFGIQQLRRPDDKVVIFSVWDPTRGNDPGAVDSTDRVELLHEGEGVRIRRFGGEGTGGQCMAPLPWKTGEIQRFLLGAEVQGAKTAYTAWVFRPDQNAWWKLATFRTRTGGQPLKGYYSFVEDFRRDYKSVHEVRRARFGNGWVKSVEGEWAPLRKARFTASGASWESKENIDAGQVDDWFYLATGGKTERSRELRSMIELDGEPDGSGPTIPLPHVGQRRDYSIPLLDLSRETGRQVIVDREPGQYLGHPSTVLLEDGKTLLIVYPKGHGRGAIVMKRSVDGGLTWSERLPVPDNWATSLETPTIHRVVDPAGKKRLIVWSGLYPARLAVSEDDGRSWTPLRRVGDWGGIVIMGSLVELNDGPGRYLAMFHDDGRFFAADGKRADPTVMTLYQTFSEDGGLTWSFPETLWHDSAIHLCEPGIIRSPDGKQLAALLRENRRVRNSYVIFSNDEGKTWSNPRELPGSLTGDRHTGKHTPDGRLFVTFRDTTHETVSQGDWVAWVGKYEDIVEGREGEYRVRLMDNLHRWDCAYPPVEVLPDGTIVTTTYGHWIQGEQPYIVSVRLKLEELDRKAKTLPSR